MSRYSTTSIRLPHGSRKSRKLPSSRVAPAARTRSRTRERSSTTRPKCRCWSECGELCFHQRYELVIHINESLPFASPSQLEGEDLSVEGERLINVTNLHGHVVQANKPRLRF